MKVAVVLFLLGLCGCSGTGFNPPSAQPGSNSPKRLSKRWTGR